MKDNAIIRLAAANPVSHVPMVEPPERLRRLIEDQQPTPPAARREAPHGRALRTLLALAIPIAGLVVAATIAWQRGPSLNVAAAAYAASSPTSGILEARFIERLFDAAHPTISYRRREWIEASSGRRREQRTLPSHTTFEVASSPGWIETWSGSAHSKGAIDRMRYRPAGSALGEEGTPGIETYRRLYQEHLIKLVGHERLHGRELWKLESVAAFAKYSAHAKPVPIFAEVVLVDPSTYLPVVQRQIDLLRAGHPVVAESELVAYRRLGEDPQSQALLEVSSQHPGLRVLTREPGHSHARRVTF